jgi:hypothetical protein
MIATARGQQRPRTVQNPAYRLARHFYLFFCDFYHTLNLQ